MLRIQINVLFNMIHLSAITLWPLTGELNWTVWDVFHSAKIWAFYGLPFKPQNNKYHKASKQPNTCKGSNDLKVSYRGAQCKICTQLWRIQYFTSVWRWFQRWLTTAARKLWDIPLSSNIIHRHIYDMLKDMQRLKRILKDGAQRAASSLSPPHMGRLNSWVKAM